MQLTTEQLKAAEAGAPVEIRAHGQTFVLLSHQAYETYNQRLRHAVVAQFTSNMDEKDDDACVLIEAATGEGRAAGLSRDSLVLGYMLSVLSEDLLQEKIGRLSDATMRKVDDCLKAALGVS